MKPLYLLCFLVIYLMTGKSEAASLSVYDPIRTYIDSQQALDKGINPGDFFIPIHALAKKATEDNDQQAERFLKVWLGDSRIIEHFYYQYRLEEEAQKLYQDQRELEGSRVSERDGSIRIIPLHHERLPCLAPARVTEKETSFSQTQFPSRLTQMDTLSAEMVNILFTVDLGNYLVNLQHRGQDLLNWSLHTGNEALFEAIIKNFPRAKILKSDSWFHSMPPTPKMASCLRKEKLLDEINGLRDSKAQEPLTLRAVRVGNFETALALAERDISVLMTPDTYGLNAAMFIDNPNRQRAWEGFIENTEIKLGQSSRNLAFAVRGLRSLNSLGEEYPHQDFKAQETANLIATGGTSDINFERSPTTEEWQVIRESLAHTAHFSLKRSSLVEAFDYLSNILFNVTLPSLETHYTEAYLAHRQNAYIGAAVAAVKANRNDLADDTIWTEMGGRVGLNAAETKSRSEWLDSQWPS